jgi:hypothetical protein
MIISLQATVSGYLSKFLICFPINGFEKDSRPKLVDNLCACAGNYPSLQAQGLHAKVVQ